MSSDRGKQLRSFVVMAGLLVAGGGVLRLSALDRTPLSPEELIHLYAGRSLERGAGSRLPSGVVYGRGVPFSRLVGATEPHVRSAELAVRLPSAVLGTAALALFAVVALTMLGAAGAGWAILLFAVDPTQIELSRSGRFYPLQLLMGLVALGAAWHVVAPQARGDVAGAPLVALPAERAGAAGMLADVGLRWAWLALATVAFALAAGLQVTTLTVALGCALAFALVGAADLRTSGARAWRTSVPLQAAALALAAVALVPVLAPRVADAVLVRAQSAPVWSRERGASPLGYAQWLWQDSAGGLLLAALGFFLLWARRRRLALFLAPWFAVPFLLHSLLLPMRARQYLLLATPALFLAEGAAAAWLYEQVRAFVRLRTERAGRRAWRAAAIMLVPGALVLAAAAPATQETVYGFQVRARRALQPDWRAAAAVINGDPALAALPLGGTHPLPALWYVGRVDFAVRVALRERWVGVPTSDGGNGYGWMPVGSPDLYAGVPVLPAPDAIRARFENRGAVLVAASAAELANGSLDRSLQTLLTTRAADVCRGRCGSLRLYLWRFEGR